ncbi:MAG: hypothetical protein U1F35_05405 [Steroidobacteraceae bacterium]
MPIPNHSFHIALTPSGVVNSRFPDGNDGSSAVPLVWANVPSTLLNQEGAPVNINLRSFLTEPGSPSATLSMVGNLPAGWSFASSTLSFSGTGIGSSPVQVRAVRGAFTVDSNFFTVESIPAAAADTQPPTAATGLTLSLISGGVAGSFDAASDIKAPGITSSLMKEYAVLRDGVAIAGSPFASAPGISVGLAFGSVGTPSPAISSTSQSGGDYAFTIGGDALRIFGATDSLAFIRAQMTGNFTIIAEVDFATSAQAFAKVGLMMRAGLGLSDPFVHVVKFSDSSTNGVAFETRATLGGAPVQQLAVANVNGRTLLKLNRSGNVFTGYYWNGSQWSQLGSVNIGMTDPIYAGLAGNSGAAGVSISATIRQLNIQNLAAVSFTDTAAGAGAHTYTVIPKDLANNTAAAGSGATITVGSTTRNALGLCSYNTGGNQTYDTNGNVERCSLESISIMSFFPQWESGRIRTKKQVCDDIKAKSTVGTKIVQYFDAVNIQDPTPNAYSGLRTAMDSANWWLRTSFPAGSIVPGSSSGYLAGNVAAGGPTLAGRTYQQYMAAYTYDFAVGGGAAGLVPTSGNAANSSLDGWYEDDILRVKFGSGDYLRTGSASGTDADQRSGCMAILNILKAAKPGSLVGANVSQFQAVGSVSTEIDGQLDFAIMEAMIGETWSYETFLPSPASELKRIYAKQMAILKPGGIGMFVHMSLTSDGRDNNGTNPATTSSQTPYQGLRHGLACCLVLGDADYCPAGTSHYSVGVNTALWFDEYSVNRATAVPYTTPTSASAPGMGYLGPWVDPPQTAPTQGTAYRRRATYGEVWWNPKGGSSLTINFGRTVRFIQGTQAPLINKGGTGTTAPMSVRDGLIVLY